jgi:hypothetical protein
MSETKVIEAQSGPAGRPAKVIPPDLLEKLARRFEQHLAWLEQVEAEEAARGKQAPVKEQLPAGEADRDAEQ